MFGLGKYDEYDKEDFVSADDLSRAIEDLADKCRHHIGYIERALDKAEDYACGLRGKTVPLELLNEGWSYVRMAEGEMSSFDYATEAALNLRRAGDAPLNNHYG